MLDLVAQAQKPKAEDSREGWPKRGEGTAWNSGVKTGLTTKGAERMNKAVELRAEGLKLREIAEILGCHTSNVWHLLKKSKVGEG